MPTTELPNGAVIEDCNRAETPFLYQEIFGDRVYLQHGVELRPRATVIDVGANIGLFALFVAEQQPDARVFAFEPAPDTFALLERNLARLPPERARTFCMGVGARCEERIFTYYPWASGMSSFHANLAQEREVLRALVHAEARQLGPADAAALLDNIDDLLDARLGRRELLCPVTTLQAFMAEQQIDRVDLLKIDAQKCEREILDGVAEPDWPRIEQIVMEVHAIDDRVEVIETLLSARGYTVVVDRPELTAGTVLRMLYARRA